MKKILLVEDEKILTEMYQEKLIQAGFKVILAFSAEEGLRTIKKVKIDLVVLDVLLPKENGIFFLEQKKKDPKISSIPVIVFSNYNDPECQKKADEYGAEDYLIKTDLTPGELVKKIRQYI